MGSLGKRLARLEKRHKDRLASADEEARDTLVQDVLERLSDEELDTYEQALERLLDAGKKPAEEDRWIFARVDRIYQQAERQR